MHAQATRSLIERDADLDRSILSMLLADPVVWHTDEIAREMNDPLEATDSINRLAAHGLVHLIDGGFVTPTRAAARASEIAG